jgi:SAM-dependent methyltransferase
METLGSQYDDEQKVLNYRRSHEKPDKKFSILPTVLSLVGDVRGKVVLDCGCGDGFFTRPLAESGAKQVIGIDNESAQIELARKQNNQETIIFSELDIYTAPALPEADVICAPFVVGYAESVDALKSFFEKSYNALYEGGTLVLVINIPSTSNLKKYGAEKRIAKECDGALMHITLYDAHGSVICVLPTLYYTPSTIGRLLDEVGFVDITWHTPIISAAGIAAYGPDFWDGYIDNPELGYLTARKTPLAVHKRVLW